MPLLWNMISLHVSRKGARLSLACSAPQRLALASRFVATFHQVDIWLRAGNLFLLHSRDHGLRRHSIHILEQPRLPLSTSSMSWHPRKESFPDADFDIRATTQGSDSDLQRTIMFLSAPKHLDVDLFASINNAILGRFGIQIFNRCRVFEGATLIPKP